MTQRFLLEYNQLGIVHDGNLYIGRFRQYDETGRVIAHGPFSRVELNGEGNPTYRSLRQKEEQAIAPLFAEPGDVTGQGIQELSDVIAEQPLKRRPNLVPLIRFSREAILSNMGP